MYVHCVRSRVRSSTFSFSHKIMMFFRGLSRTTSRSISSSITLPSLPYAYDALEPIISTEIMTIHHTKHHATYIANVRFFFHSNNIQIFMFNMFDSIFNVN